jgi:Tfp pilus assembly protein PilF
MTIVVGPDAHTPGSASDATEPAAPRSVAPGRILGRYVVVEPIGEGGMASVHRAYDPRLAREIAIKIMRWDDPEQARSLYERALSIRERLLGAEHPDCAIALNNLAGIEYAQGHLERSGTLFGRALEIRESAFGPDHPDVASTLGNLANVWVAQGKNGEARAAFERAVTVLERTAGAGHPKTLGMLNNLGALAMVERRNEEARGYFERALRIAEATLGPDHPAVAAIVGNLGMLSREAGELGRARSELERAVAIRAAALGDDHVETAISKIELSRLELVESRPAVAQRLAEQALATLERRRAAPGEVARARFALAQALWADSAQRSRARELAELAAAEAELDEGERGFERELAAWLAGHRAP